VKDGLGFINLLILPLHIMDRDRNGLLMPRRDANLGAFMGWTIYSPFLLYSKIVIYRSHHSPA
jgi:hypothetical protein